MARFDADQVRRYYDRHTAAFVGLGAGGSYGAIHRAVWAPGVRDRRAAFHYVEDRIADVLRSLTPAQERLHVVDLGCGIGASLQHLAHRLPIRGTGVTLSSVQAEQASRRLREAGVADRVRCVEADICSLPPNLAPADAAYAIESFVHVPSPARFFDECRRLIRPGGVLAICDDFRAVPLNGASPPGTTVPRTLASGREANRRAARGTIERFCRGWHVNTLVDRDELRANAETAGFAHEATLDLSPYLQLRRVRDRVIGALLRPFRWVPADRVPFGYLLGGDALQTCLQRGWIVYELVVFRRIYLTTADGVVAPFRAAK